MAPVLIYFCTALGTLLHTIYINLCQGGLHINFPDHTHVGRLHR